MSGSPDKPNAPSLPRMADVAEAAGVTQMTVSRALRDPDKVAPGTLARVKAAIAETGYVPNVVAGVLSGRSKSRIVTAVIPTIQHAIFADTVTGLSEALRPHGYHLMLGETGYRLEEEDALIAAFLAHRPDAFMLTGVTRSKHSRNLLKRSGVPIVETWELARTPLDMVVGYSNEDAAHAMTRYLAERGYRRIAFVSGPSRTNERARRRELGYARALGELGLPVLPILTIGEPSVPHLEEGAAILDAVLALTPDAVFFTSDVYAVGALMAAQARCLDVPGALGIAGFHDLPIARVVSPGLTTVHVPAHEIGVLAGRKILASLAGAAEPKKSIIPFTLVPRQSTR
ncbi:LacI family DNA-binding transcriptional regulator [Bosea sp. (in: a-proteobacteria)]|uniref:LacI family DNA-binding transcriptional regulator n=1 Tax=Bosea sp. (in: a-proteobacteria) TaxID=1871050 RepID=UPI0026071844|nr:LacI family DNA-binding transcriptional regulator [Bosea sp. (in: a-proteobacteria)]MCO5093379.1 LacI family DNA-binding transcriptional regulator [Bosea sp. (in: a-proteobacteria)]